LQRYNNITKFPNFTQKNKKLPKIYDNLITTKKVPKITTTIFTFIKAFPFTQFKTNFLTKEFYKATFTIFAAITTAMFKFRFRF
jgi:hypothetical protein